MCKVSYHWLLIMLIFSGIMLKFSNYAEHYAGCFHGKFNYAHFYHIMLYEINYTEHYALCSKHLVMLEMAKKA